MTTRAEREELLQGRDPVALAIARWFEAKGWVIERIIRNVLQKTYSPHTATLRIELDSAYRQYMVQGEYTSCGENVLSIYTGIIEADASPEEMNAVLQEFLVQIERAINQSYAVRRLGPPVKKEDVVLEGEVLPPEPQTNAERLADINRHIEGIRNLGRR